MRAILQAGMRQLGPRMRAPLSAWPGPWWVLLGVLLVTTTRLFLAGPPPPPTPQPLGTLARECTVPVENPGLGVRCMTLDEAQRRGLSAGAILPAVPGAPPGRMSPERLLTAGVRLDLSTATVAELAALPEVGPRLAERIVAARSRDRLRTRAELLQVPGLGTRRLARLTPFLQPLP